MLTNDDLQNQGGPVPTGRSVAADYVYAKNPETGLDVVFVPGEALPEFAQAEQERAKLDTLPSMPDPGKKPVKGSTATAQ